MTMTADQPLATEILARVQKLLPVIAERAEQGETARAIPQESAQAFLDAGLARALAPRRFGGYELGLDVWFDAVHAIGTTDASHAWCASLIMHHPQYLAQFPLEAQEAVWDDGPDVAVASSVNPTTTVTKADGGYRLTGKAPFTSGIAHASWAMIGGMLPVAGPPRPALFLVPRSHFTVQDVWHTTGMRGTGSNLIVTDDVFVPENLALPLADLIEGTGPGGRVHDNPIYRTPLVTYGPATFAIPMLGAARGALEAYRAFAAPRQQRPNAVVAATTARIRMGRAAADLDAAELLLRRSLDLAARPADASIELRARSMRDAGRAAELITGSMNDLIALSGTAGFAADNVLQRHWRDVNFAARHVTLNPDANYAYWSGTQLGVERNPAEVNVF